MIKTAAIFPAQAARNSVPVLAAVRDSLHQANVIVQENCMTSDAVVIWSVLWAGRMKSNQAIYDHYRALGRPIIVIDVGSLIRGVTWKIAIGNINGSGWFGNDHDLDPDRPRRLGLLRSSPAKGDDIVIALQHRQSLQVQMLPSMEQWVFDQIDRTRQYTDRDIVIRPHPRDPIYLGRLPAGVRIEIPQAISETYDSFDWRAAWHAVINHNSGPGVLAAIDGVRPIVDSTSLAWPVSTNIAEIERPYDIDRETWLIKLSHTEYTLDEIANGTWLKRLGSKL